MRRIRYKIAGLMGLVAIAAIGLSAFRSLPDRRPGFVEGIALGLNLAGRWASELSILVGLSPLAAIAIVLASKGRVRATAAGYAAFGVAYYVMGKHVEQYNSFLHDHVVTPGFWTWIHQISFTYNKMIHFAPYVLATHCSLTVVAGMTGGLLARALARRPGDLARPTTSPTGQP